MQLSCKSNQIICKRNYVALFLFVWEKQSPNRQSWKYWTNRIWLCHTWRFSKFYPKVFVIGSQSIVSWTDWFQRIWYTKLRISMAWSNTRIVKIVEKIILMTTFILIVKGAILLHAWKISNPNLTYQRSMGLQRLILWYPVSAQVALWNRKDFELFDLRLIAFPI